MTQSELTLFAYRFIRKEVTSAEPTALTAEELVAINLCSLARRGKLNAKTQQMDEKEKAPSSYLN